MSTTTHSTTTSTTDAPTTTPAGALPETDVIDAHQARQLLAEDPRMRIIDVRTGGEFATAHIPGAFNVPLDTLGEHVADLADLEHPTLLVCQSGNRARQAQGQLERAGKQRLHLLDGGMNAWIAAGGDVRTTDSSTWALDRQVRLVAGGIALAGILASVVAPKAKWLSGAVAGGLVFSAVTDTCAMGTLLGRLPYNRGAGCDIDGVLDELRRAA